MERLKFFSVLIAFTLLFSGCGTGSTATSAQPLPSDDGATEITVEVDDVVNFYANAALKFETMTGVKVNVINHYNPATAIDDQDYAYLDRIPGDLMAGKGADIYANINLDFAKIGKQGYFINLADWVAADPDLSDDKYYTNIWHVRFDAGDKYSLPLKMVFMALGSEVEIPELDGKDLNWEEFFNVTKGINRNGVLLGLSDSEIFMRRFNDRYSSFIDEEKKTETLNSPELVQLLEQSKAWSEQGLCLPNNAENFEDMHKNSFIKQYCSDVEVLTNVRFIDGPSSLSPYWYDIPSDSGTYDKSNKLLTTNHICINANSPNTGTAWKFLKFLLSKDVQLTGYSTPMNREAAAQYIKNSLTSSIGDSALNEDAAQKIEDAETILDNLSDSPDKYKKNGINKILSKEANRYFNNEVSAEDAARNMSESVKLYMKEQ